VCHYFGDDPACWYMQSGGGFQCANQIDIMKPVCLAAPRSDSESPGLSNCQPEHAQKWSLQPYRTTWQARIGYSIYRKGPDVVKRLEVTQTPGCDVIGKESDGTVKLMGTIKGQQVEVEGKRLNLHAPLGEEGFLDVEGTVNTKETMLSWNTVPPTYWVKESVLEGRPTLNNTVKLQVKDAIARERSIKSAERAKKIGELDSKAVTNAKGEVKTKAIEALTKEKANKVRLYKGDIATAAKDAKNRCQGGIPAKYTCTDQLCGPFKKKGYAKKAGPECTRANKSNCAAVCGFGMVYPIEYKSPIGQAKLHKLEPKKHPKFIAAQYGKKFFATHGWPKATINGYYKKGMEEKAVCKDTPFLLYGHLDKRFTQGRSPKALCAYIKSQGKCLDPSKQHWLGDHTWKRFATLFCRKTCQLPVDSKTCTPNRKSIRDTAAKEKNDKKKKKHAAEQALKMARKYKKFQTCNNQHGLKGAGTSQWEKDRVNRRLLGSGHDYSPTWLNFDGGGCYDVAGKFLGHGPCQALGGAAATDKQMLWRTGYGGTNVGTWVATNVCQPLCSGSRSGTVHHKKCVAFNSLLHYRRRHGRIFCQQYATSSSVCEDYSKCDHNCQTTGKKMRH